jgi:hypothetical protein
MGVVHLSSFKPVISLKVTGKLTKAGLGRLQNAAITGIENWGKVRALIVLENFRGWEKESGWEDISLSSDHEQKVEKLAIVGPQEWKDLVYAFVGKGLRPMAIEFFLPSQLEEARMWLSSDSPGQK